MTFFQEIKEALIKGEDFNNESADWATQNCGFGALIIWIGDTPFFYKNFTSYAKRIKQLINRGY
jgi:hypothetical protein|tara:strand:- start:315 stop:506 length:192 start_codon:yes stop_codon:yes gene_type:complete